MHQMTEKERKTFDMVEKKISESSSLLSGLHKKFNELEDLYFFYTPRSKNSAKSNVFDPMAFEAVEHMVSHLFAAMPRGTYVPMDPNDDTKVEIANALTKYQWNKPGANMRKKMTNMGRNMALFGTAFGVLHWRYERRYNQLTKQFETVWDDPYFEDLNIYDCYPDVNARTPADMQYFIHDEYLTYEDLKAANAIAQGVSKYSNLDDLKDMIKSGASVGNGYRDRSFQRRYSQSQSLDKPNRIKVRRYYDKQRWITTLPDYNMVIEDRPNPYMHGELPVVTLIDHDYPNLLFGIGEVEPIKSLITFKNQLLGMRADNIKVILEPSFRAKASALKHSKTWKHERNAMWVVDDMNDIQFNTVPDATGAPFQATVNLIEDTVARRTGRFDVLSRNEAGGTNRTATEVKAMVGEQNARMRYKENNIDEFIKQLNTMWLQLNQQFMQKPRLIRITGREDLQQLQSREVQGLSVLPDRDYGFLDVTNEDILGVFDFVVENGSTREADINNEVQNYTMALNTLSQYGPMLAQFKQMGVDLEPVLKAILDRLNIKNSEKVINTPQMPQQPMDGSEELMADEMMPTAVPMQAEAGMGPDDYSQVLAQLQQ